MVKEILLTPIIYFIVGKTHQILSSHNYSGSKIRIYVYPLHLIQFLIRNHMPVEGIG